MSHRIQFFVVGALSILVSGTLATPRGGGAAVEVRVKENAVAQREGQEVLVHVQATCDPVGEVLEAFVQVHQDPVFGDGFFAPICDGVQREYLVRVHAIDGAFARGDAHASAFVLICDKKGNCKQGQDSRTIAVRGPKPQQ